MGVRELKTYRLTCDGEVMWKEFQEGCDATLDVQYACRYQLDIDLDRNMVGGWHTIYSGVRCPRTDHIGDDQP